MNEEIQTTEVETTEENQLDSGETGKETSQTKEPSAIEQRALEMGWRPKEEFDGDEEDFIDAQEFVRRKPLFEKIDSVGKELRETRKALKALQEHHAKVKEAEFKHALEQLRAEKKVALEEGDADKLIEIDEQIADAKVRQLQEEKQARQEASAPHPNFINWVQKNPWYKEDAELKAAADQIGSAYAVSNPEVEPDQVLKYVEGRVRKLYPDKFRNPNKDRPSAVEARTSSTTSKSKGDDVSNYPLTDEERKVMMSFVRQGIMTKEEYITDLKRVKGE
jgi:hypothetical protein